MPLTLLCALVTSACTTEPVEEQLGYETTGIRASSVAVAQLREPPATWPEYEHEAQLFARDFFAHLEQRGVTPEVLEAAALAGGEERVRELLGFTDAEYEAWYARLVEIVTTAESISAEDVGYPEGWTCLPEVIPCITSIGLAYLVAGGAISVPALLAYGGIHAAGCVYTYCSYDRTDPGPPVNRP